MNENNIVDVNLTGDALNEISSLVNKINVIISSLGLNSSRINIGTILNSIRNDIKETKTNQKDSISTLKKIYESISTLNRYITSRGGNPDDGEPNNDLYELTYKGVESLQECEDKLGDIWEVNYNSADSIQECEDLLKKILDAIKSGVPTPRPEPDNPNPPSPPNPPNPPSDDSNDSDSDLESVKNALEETSNNVSDSVGALNKSNLILEQISDIGKKTFELIKNNFVGVFDKWNAQIATLKEQGMGSSNAAQLNRMTKSTMNNTEDLLGFNISIDKAIKSTNDILSSGFSPMYMRENNKQLLMGLSSLGIKLENDTVREIGNQVFNATHVKELTGDLAKLVSSDSENRMDAAVLSRAFNSQEFKTIVSTAMMQTGASRQEVEKRFAELLIQNKQAGRTDEESISRAYIDIQSTLGGGAYTYLPKEIQSMIEMQKMANPNWDLKRDGLSSRYDIEAYNSNVEFRRRVNQISPTLMLGSDNTLWNIQNNDGTMRKMATSEEIEQGQYEGFLPRVAKGFAGLFNAESMGGTSQSLTGDSSFITKRSFDVVGSVSSSLGGLLKEQGLQVFYLKKIDQNTSGGGALAGTIKNAEKGVGANIGGFKDMFSNFGSQYKSFASSTSGKLAGAAGIGLAALDTITDIYTKADEASSSQKMQLTYQERIIDLNSRESALREEYNKALLSGNSENIKIAKKMLQDNEEARNQQLDAYEKADDEAMQSKITAWSKGILAVAGGVIGGIFGGPLGAALGAEAGNFLGGGIGKISGLVMEESDEDSKAEKRRENLNKFYYGGIIDKEQLALVGEGNNPEVVLPLNNPNRVEELLGDVQNMSSVPDETKEKLNPTKNESEEIITQTNKDIKSTIAYKMIEGARAQFGKTYSEMVCNQMVEAAMKWAGMNPPVTGSVFKHFNNENMHLVLNDPENGISPTDPKLLPGMIMFSHPFTESEAAELNKKKGGKRKAGDPGHMGIYAGDGLWWNSTSSKNTVDYSSGTAVKVKNADKGYGVALTKPFTKGTYKLYAAGYYNGMFDETETANMPEVSSDFKFDETETAEVSSNFKFNETANIPEVSSDFKFNETTNSNNEMGDTKYNIKTPMVSSNFKFNETTNSNNEMGDTKYNIKTPTSYIDFKRYIEKFDNKNNVYKLMLESKLNEGTSALSYKLLNNNPFDLKNIDGSIVSYNTLEDGINAFIDKMDKQFNYLSTLSEIQQIQLMRNSGNISSMDYSRVISSLDRLSSSVEESNRISNRNRSLPTSEFPRRNYV